MKFQVLAAVALMSTQAAEAFNAIPKSIATSEELWTPSLSSQPSAQSQKQSLWTPPHMAAGGGAERAPYEQEYYDGEWFLGLSGWVAFSIFSRSAFS